MAGALNALQVGSLVTDPDGWVVACCPQFSAFVGRPEHEILGRRGREFMRIDDVPIALRFLDTLWSTGASFTMTAHIVKPNGRSTLYESHVSRLLNPSGHTALSIVRPFKCLIRAIEPDAERAASKAGYVVDMSGQLAEFASHAFMPVTSDLLRVAADAAAREGGVGTVKPQSA